MAIANEIAYPALMFKQNEGLLAKSIAGLTPEEWLRRPSAELNHLLWIMGHLIFVRSLVLGALGVEWTRPWFPLFARGAKLVNDSEYPSSEEITSAWTEVVAIFVPALDQANSDVLAAPPPHKVPSMDGKVSGMIGFMAFHETYHVGQTSYLRRWLGHEGIAG